ncbi:MAG TPA: competence/damage-inducible protein A, partial [Beijerinckia sp.]|nr:competence/damage-inducible protein A [Beijerinckia sp.]
PMIARTIIAGNVPEGAYAAALGELALANRELSIGSYPSVKDGKFYNQIVVRGKNPVQVESVAEAVEAMVAQLEAGLV